MSLISIPALIGKTRSENIMTTNLLVCLTEKRRKWQKEASGVEGELLHTSAQIFVSLPVPQQAYSGESLFLTTQDLKSWASDSTVGYIYRKKNQFPLLIPDKLIHYSGCSLIVVETSSCQPWKALRKNCSQLLPVTNRWFYFLFPLVSCVCRIQSWLAFLSCVLVNNTTPDFRHMALDTLLILQRKTVAILFNIFWVFYQFDVGCANFPPYWFCCMRHFQSEGFI